jgi:tRNA(fMet)-specific endonuclease VapC
MTRFLLDTGTASDYVNRRRGVFERARAELKVGYDVGIAITVLSELVYGIEKSRSRDKNRSRLIGQLSSLRLWPFDRDAAFECGRIRAEHFLSGRMIQFADATIAAIALTLPKTVIVTKDSDLSTVRGLRVENWAT